MSKGNSNKNKIRLLFLFAGIIISFSAQAQDFYLLIGSFTGKGSKGIYVYDFNASTGNTKWISNTDSATNPSFITISGSGKYVYSVNKANGTNEGWVSSYSFNQLNGKLHFLNARSSGGVDPCHLAINTLGNWLTVANYSSGSTSIFPINKNGLLQPYAQLIQTDGSSINKDRQEKSHIHETIFSPDNAYLFTPDLGTDKVMIYGFNPASKKPLRPASPPYVSIAPGSGPRHITFHPNKKFAYVINELGGSVIAYKYDKGKFTELQTIITHPADYKGDIGAAEINISPDGKFLYASNRGDENSITIFSINPGNGKLNLLGYEPTVGKNPRYCMIDPTGNYLLVANQDTDNIVIFKRNKQTGYLKATGQQIKISKPVCLQMIPKKSTK